MVNKLMARVKKSHKQNTVIAFGGREFVKSEFREVPDGSEAEAKNHPYLDVKAPDAKKAPADKPAAKKTTAKKAPEVEESSESK